MRSHSATYGPLDARPRVRESHRAEEPVTEPVDDRATRCMREDFQTVTPDER